MSDPHEGTNAPDTRGTPAPAGEDAATAAREELQRFVSVASHDLREPVRKVRMFGQRLRDHAADALDERSIGYLDRIQDAAERMDSLLDSLLIYSRAGSRELELRPIGLDAAVRRLMREFDAEIQRDTASVTVNAELGCVVADREQLEHLLRGILCNALLYHPPNEPARVSIEAGPPGVDGWVRIDVRDEGIGIAPEHHEQVFEPFVRLHGRREFPGRGLGLSIARRIAERLGGSVTLVSALGRGATVTITLPRADVPDDQPP